MGYSGWIYLVLWYDAKGEHRQKWADRPSAEEDFTKKVQAGYSARLCHFLPGEEYYWDGDEITLMESL